LAEDQKAAFKVASDAAAARGSEALSRARRRRRKDQSDAAKRGRAKRRKANTQRLSAVAFEAVRGAMHGALEVVSECDDSDDSDDRSDGDSDSDSDGDSGDDSDGDSDGNSGGGASGSGGGAAARERARSDASTVLARAKQEFSLFKEVLDSQSTAETPRIGEGLRREGIRKRIDSGGTSGSREAVVPSEAGIRV
jgi:hypothetical protein